VRGIYPTIATITAGGFERVTNDDVAARFRTLLDSLATPQGSAAPAPSGVATARPGGDV
jgi:hypothetical protein